MPNARRIKSLVLADKTTLRSWARLQSSSRSQGGSTAFWLLSMQALP
jgi:hypothetical protein